MSAALLFAPGRGLGWNCASMDQSLCLRLEPRGLFKDDAQEGKRWFWWNVLVNGRKVAYGREAERQLAIDKALQAIEAAGLPLEQLPQVGLPLW